jgi:hypothetical protein
LVEKDDQGWYPQLRMYYYLTLGREFLTNRDSKRAKSLCDAGENSVWKPDFNKGQLMSTVMLLESLNLLQFLTPEVQLRGSDSRMQQLKALAVQNRHVIKNYLDVSISEGLTSVAIAQKLLAKIDLKLSYIGRLGSRENRECVYQFVLPDDERDLIFGQWLSRDEASALASTQNIVSDSVSVTNNIELPIQVIDTTLQDIPQASDSMESSSITQGWKGLKLRLQQGLDNACKLYTLASLFCG